MALQAAMDFIEAIPLRPQLADVLAEVGDYEDLRRIGELAGFDFTGDELDLAFRHRCSMRWLRHFPRLESKGVS